MSEVAKPLVYLLLGAVGSGRREVLADLVAEGLEEDEKAVVLLPEAEPADERDLRLGTTVRWSWEGSALVAPREALKGATHLFVLSDGRGNPVDQVEAFKPWMESVGGEIGRVFTVVNCQLAERIPALMEWYDACIHFSDAVLLAKREGVANKWISTFQARFKDQFYPCLFEWVKEGKVKNPALLLEPQPRRMSHYFDEPEWVVLEEEEDFEMGSETEEGATTEEEVEVVLEVDPYFERKHGGRRVKELPDIASLL